VAPALLVADSTLTFWIPPFASPARTDQASFKARASLFANSWLVLINAHVTWWPRCSIDKVEQAMAAKWRQTIITVLTTLPQGWVSACKHQCTTVITTMWTESSWVFPESYTAGSCAGAMADNGETKGLITAPQGEFLHNYYMSVSLHDSDHQGVVRIFVALSCELWGYLFSLIRLRGTIFPYQESNIMRHNFSFTRSVTV